MRFLLTPDSYKESLSASKAAQIMEKTILKVMPDAVCDIAPMADGGEGTAECLMYALNGEKIYCDVTGPMGEKVLADFVWIESQKKAIIEVARACGMMLVHPDKKDPLEASTYGVGEMICHAVDLGCRELVLTLGGTITNDGGIGMLVALGANIMDKGGNNIPLGGKGLEKIETIDLSRAVNKLKDAKVTVLCDVKSPLLGEKGATYMFGPQKGATGHLRDRLENGMKKYALAINEAVGKNIAIQQGAGAAGGLGCALYAVCEAKYVNGAEYVMNALDLEERIKKCDYVITGEGSMDAQSLEGKVPVGVAQIARKYNKPVIAFVGMSNGDSEKFYEKGITAIFCIIRKLEPIKTILLDAEQNLEHAVENFARVLSGTTI